MRQFVWALALVPVACTGGDTDAPVDTDVPVQTPVPQGFITGEFCLVRTIFEVTCVTGCHSGAVPGGGLDLQTDPWTAMIDRPSQSSPGLSLVTVGNATDSILYRKMTGLIAEGQGDAMPPRGVLPADITDIVRDWIDQGAVNDCVFTAVPGGEPPPPPPPPVVDPEEPQGDTYHPPGYDAADVHGVAMNLQNDGDCRSCHGSQLEGGQQAGAVGCDGCHQGPAWRTDCAFCHGTAASSAPPEDIDNQADPALISFVSHGKHIEVGYDCTQCHYNPTEVMTNGHIFGDVTPGYGEVYNAGGLAVASTYADGTCSNNYCHGNGRGDNGTATDGEGPLGCTSCHAGPADPAGWNQMSGAHRLHLEVDGVTCSECHGNTVDAGNAVIGPTYHVNAVKDYVNADVPLTGASCVGACHGFDHAGAGW
jgi:predicted CxxxxCH...CXXCH cytochrome family protein